MNLSEFMSCVKTQKTEGHWVVRIPLKDGSTGKVFVDNADNIFEAEEKAFIYLNNTIKEKQRNGRFQKDS